jgi:hypothetical protein
VTAATPTDEGRGLAVLTLVIGLGHLTVPLLGIPLDQVASVGALLVVVASAMPVLIGAALIRARPRRAAAWLVPPLVVHLVRTVPAIPTIHTVDATVVVRQGLLAVVGVVLLVGLWRTSPRAPSGPTSRTTSRWLLAAAAIAAGAPLAAPVGFRTASGVPLEGWWTSTLVGADAGFALFLAVQVVVALAGIAVVARLPAALGGVAAIAWALPLAVAGVVAIIEALVEPILVPLPLAVVTTLAAVGTVLLGWRERRVGRSPAAVPPAA